MLVLPIKTLLGHYIYDANRNEILAVSKDLFNYISEVQAGEVCPDSYKSDQEFQLLQSCGYCCDSPLQDVAYPSIDLLKVKLERNLRMITLQLTQSCNFRCDYCIYSENSLYYTTEPTVITLCLFRRPNMQSSSLRCTRLTTQTRS